ncbi:MAG: hypothetical protein VX777_02075 [Chlamydiota bacterium]|nr:hypothetical protein [Chlamydiota bacterium]
MKNVKSTAPYLKKVLQEGSKFFFLLMGLTFSTSSLGVACFALWNVIQCLNLQCDTLITLLDFVGYLIISVAIFDVGRYLLEEEVFRERELRSPKEARQSLTKFMVIIVIAVTLEALLSVIRAGTKDVSLLIYPAALFLVATLLLIGLGLFQRLSVAAEVNVKQTLND